MPNKVIPLIVAGGKGSRFWPLSRENFPKQFLSLDGGDPLLKRSFLRAEQIAAAAVPYIIAGAEQQPLVYAALDRQEGFHFIGEPLGKNTAAAIYYACSQMRFKGEEGIVVVLPADHQIKNEEGFAATIKKAAAVAAEKQSLVVIGIPPRYPATGYGYAERGKKEYLEHEAYYKVRRFVEKPHREKARRYLKKGTYCWNSGILVFPLSIIFDVFQRHLPAYCRFFTNPVAMDYDEIKEFYEEAENVSFDVGVLEKEKNVYLIEADFHWDDVGSFNSLAALIPPNDAGNIRRGNQLLKDVRNSVVLTDNLYTAVVGLKDVAVIMDHGVLLICPRSRVEEVRGIVDSLDGENEQFR